MKGRLCPRWGGGPVEGHLPLRSRNGAQSNLWTEPPQRRSCCIVLGFQKSMERTASPFPSSPIGGFENWEGVPAPELWNVALWDCGF